jgi:hypothetical protein
LLYQRIIKKENISRTHRSHSELLTELQVFRLLDILAMTIVSGDIVIQSDYVK